MIDYFIDWSDVSDVCWFVALYNSSITRCRVDEPMYHLVSMMWLYLFLDNPKVESESIFLFLSLILILILSLILSSSLPYFCSYPLLECCLKLHPYAYSYPYFFPYRYLVSFLFCCSCYRSSSYHSQEAIILRVVSHRQQVLRH